MDQYKSRSETPEKYQWNLKLIYASADAWEADFNKIESHVAAVEAFKGNLSSSVAQLKRAFDVQTDLDLLIEKLYVYAHLLSDEDTRNSTNLGLNDRIRSKAADAGARLSWMDPELLETPVEALSKFQKDPILKDYARRIEHLVRSKPHQRSAEVEEVLSLASESLGVGHKAFNLLENADMKFPNVKDAKGVEHELNSASYSSYLESDDRILRKNAFEGYCGAYSQYQNTFAATLDGHVKKQIFYSKARRFNSAMEASLFSDAIPKEVYNGLIDTVHQHLPLLHRWVSLKKKLLKLDDLSLFDLFMPMVKPANVEIAYDEAMKMVVEGAKPLGTNYVEALEKAFSERWIDVYYTTGKRGGAYSSGMYKTVPYILLNHKNNLNSTFTLAHELGHSLHTYFSNSTQPYPTASYPIFLAEVASTTNEMLLHFHLNAQAKTKEMKLYLLDHLFNQFRGTLFRQVQFAEFERDIHAMAERGEPLTAETLSNHYATLNKKYYGPEMNISEVSKFEWSRIPHFYYNFYVYKYSTSFAAAQYFARKIYDGDTATREKYLELLKSGGSQDPLETLMKAGMDLRDSKPIESAFKVLEDALNEFEALIAKD
jgi:oligoendopeptidase F